MAILSSAIPAHAKGLLVWGDNADADDAIVLGAVTYTFKVEPANPGDVELGGTQAASMAKLIEAINEGLAEPELAANAAVVARQVGADEVLIAARSPGAGGNFIPAEVTTGGARFDFDPALGDDVLEDGAGDMQQFFDSLLAMNQVNSEVKEAIFRLALARVDAPSD